MWYFSNGFIAESRLIIVFIFLLFFRLGRRRGHRDKEQVEIPVCYVTLCPVAEGVWFLAVRTHKRSKYQKKKNNAGHSQFITQHCTSEQTVLPFSSVLFCKTEYFPSEQVKQNPCLRSPQPFQSFFFFFQVTWRWYRFSSHRTWLNIWHKK